jgi:hypothetical protein
MFTYRTFSFFAFEREVVFLVSVAGLSCIIGNAIGSPIQFVEFIKRFFLLKGNYSREQME